MDVKKDTVLLVGAGPSQLEGITIGHSFGLEVLAIDGDPDAPGFASADRHACCDILAGQAVAAIGRRHNIIGAIAVSSDICLRTAARVNHILGLPGLTPEQAERATNKALMREICSRSQISGPEFQVIASDRDLDHAAAMIGFPAIIKPADAAGSRGVYFVTSVQELRARYPFSYSQGRNGLVLLEQFIDGREISVEGFVTQGELTILCFSDKKRTAPPYLLDTRVLFPSRQPAAVLERAARLARDTVTALELDDCPIHMEVMLSGDEPFLVEVAARGPGFKVYSDILPHVTGVNGIELQYRILLGLPVCVTPRAPLKGACIHFFGSETAGTVRAITGLAQAVRHPLVYDSRVYAAPGDHVTPLRSGADRLGHVISLADSAREALAAADTAADLISIDIEKAPIDG